MTRIATLIGPAELENPGLGTFRKVNGVTYRLSPPLAANVQRMTNLVVLASYVSIIDRGDHYSIIYYSGIENDITWRVPEGERIIDKANLVQSRAACEEDVIIGFGYEIIED